jgi:hypothetical protein
MKPILLGPLDGANLYPWVSTDSLPDDKAGPASQISRFFKQYEMMKDVHLHYKPSDFSQWFFTLKMSTFITNLQTFLNDSLLY